jgi:glycerophosphoryl diester phosphodiesterase
LEETLKLLNELNVHPNIEIKLNDDPSNTNFQKDILSFIQVIKTNWPKEKSPPLISSFSLEVLLAIKNLEPTWPLGFLVEDFEERFLEQVIEHSLYSLHCDHKSLEPHHLESCLKAKIPVLIYTVNDPEVAKKWIELGVSAVFSDHTNLLFQDVDNLEKIL